MCLLYEDKYKFEGELKKVRIDREVVEDKFVEFKF